MKKFKYILIFLLLIVTTVVINGGTRAECSVMPAETPSMIKKAVVQGFPDLVSFANYINQ